MQLRPFAAAAIATAFVLGVAGCSATPAAEEEPAASQSADTSAEAGQSQPTGQAQPAEEPAAEEAPIEGWPAEVPVPDGELQQDSSTGGSIAAGFEVADAAAVDAYIAELEAAGFEPMEGGTTEIAGVVAHGYQGNGHLVAVSSVEVGGMVIMSVAIQAM